MDVSQWRGLLRSPAGIEALQETLLVLAQGAHAGLRLVFTQGRIPGLHIRRLS